MDRRGFLKGIFGAAVVAAMPPIVVDQIEALPEPTLISPVVNEVKPIFTRLEPIAPNGLLYIYNDTELIGISRRFNLNMRQQYIDVTDFKGWKQYLKGSLNWDISASDMNWAGDPREYFAEITKLNCIILKDNIKIIGDIYITQLEFISPMFEELSSNVEFEGSGALIIEPNE